MPPKKTIDYKYKVIYIRDLSEKHQDRIVELQQLYKTKAASQAILRLLESDIKAAHEIQKLKTELSRAKNKILAYQAYWELRNQMRLIETEFALDTADID